MELFIIGSLEELIQKIYLGSSDTSSLIASSSLLSEIAATVDEANQRFESGEVSGAQSLYEKALQKVTAIWSQIVDVAGGVNGQDVFASALHQLINGRVVEVATIAEIHEPVLG